MTSFTHTLEKLAAGRDLDDAEMAAAVRALMNGEPEDAQTAAFLTALRDKGETAVEITAAARVMLEFAVPVPLTADQLLDTCGTGGDGAGTFNISTAAAAVAAAAGAVVAKHGNRSVSSHSGSADLLEAAGVDITLDADAVAECIRRTGIGFMFAPNFHPAMRHVAPVRKALGVRTVFNLLGPLVNPARAACRLIGVFDERWLAPIAQTAAALGVRRVMTVHSKDGLDEISIAAPTGVYELCNGKSLRYELAPGDFGYESTGLDAIRADTPEASLALLRTALSGEPGPAEAAVAMNAGLGLYIAGVASSPANGVEVAREVIRDGRAAAKFDEWAETSRQLGQPQAASS